MLKVEDLLSEGDGDGSARLNSLLCKAQEVCPVNMALDSTTNPLQIYFGIFDV
jgi:hypothetical protein